MPTIPLEPAPEAAPLLLREGYAFIPRRCRRYGSDLFRARLLLEETICMTGPEAARLFYDPERFARAGAAPRRIRRTLFGEGGVQGLDDAAHRHRKGMFMSLMRRESIAQLADECDLQWREAMRRWQPVEWVVLHDAVGAILCRSVCAWAGVPLAEAEVEGRTRDLMLLVDGAGGVGLRYRRGRRARRRAERWAQHVVRGVRGGTTAAPAGSAAHEIAWHRDLGGELLDERVAAVELLNVLRPIVAVARYVVFLAHALHEHPDCAPAPADGADDALDRFVQEVRRHYPFFPFVAARVRGDFDWHGYRFPAATRVLLDLYGTSHDPRTWRAPDEFRPERFRDWQPGPFELVPQGGGDHSLGHRCAGEWLTIALMRVALRMLTGAVEYRVPPQDLRIPLSRIPAIPRSGFVIDRVRIRS